MNRLDALFVVDSPQAAPSNIHCLNVCQAVCKQHILAGEHHSAHRVYDAMPPLLSPRSTCIFLCMKATLLILWWALCTASAISYEGGSQRHGGVSNRLHVSVT